MPSLSVASPPPTAATAGSAARDFERLPLWRNAWRLVVAWLLGMVFFVVYVSPLMLNARSDLDAAVAGAFLLLDLLVGHLALVLVAFRRRRPVAVAVVATVLSAVSVLAVGPVFLAVMSLATRRRLWPLVWLGVLNGVVGAAHERLVVPWTTPAEFRESLTGQGWLVDGLVYVAFALLLYGVVVLIGWNVGSRRELVASWRRQAETATSEQAARVAQAQLAERARIAREMHDVLAHRLSLVAMHAGALAHRPDLTDQERVEAAEVVRSGAHQALEELREVLGVLRDDDREGGERRVEAPQPGLSDIPALLAEVTGSGQQVRLSVEEDLWRRSLSLPASTGRHAYRVVQESLTNARRHAAGRPVTVHVDGRPGRGLSITVANPTPPVAEGTLPSGGRGLAGLAERVQLAGGRFEAGVEVTDFVVRTWLPWPGRGGDDG
ncbi:sensor histidine kinase [Ornithinimicrobium pekingense]|uniref:histidine kinase n=1 Tax=Ornithinimicrobium pekingense TaxID=384677 RepID=A0ABQ2F3U9_9MICO|nr:histidine kinase [Ornithinimicrobium pekingense]GGK57106.1 two-component sensor histidine kinase [Ornithinimicrobium pekingense]